MSIKLVLVCWLFLGLGSGRLLASELKVSSLNVNFNNLSVEETYHLIRETRADVILLQETTSRFEQGAGTLLQDGYRYSWFTRQDQEAGGGFGVLSKLEITHKEFLPRSTGLFGVQKTVCP